MPSFEDFWNNIMIPLLGKKNIQLNNTKNKTLFIGTISNLYDLYKDEEADVTEKQKNIKKSFEEQFIQLTRSKKNLFSYFFTWDFQYIVERYIFCKDDGEDGDCSAAAVANRLRINLKF